MDAPSQPERSTLLFVYGLLQPEFQPPRSMRRHWKDRVCGLLYDLGPFPAAVAVGRSESSFEGAVLEIDEWELPALDEFEDVDEGQYARIRTETEAGRSVWIYAYRRPIPPELQPIPRWPATRPGH